MAQHRCIEWRIFAHIGLILGLLLSRTSTADDVPLLVDERGHISESVLEAFLSPGEFKDRSVTYRLDGDAALYAMDLGLGATKPFATFHPDRVTWPDIAGLPLEVERDPVSLTIAPGTTDDGLDEKVVLVLTLTPIGQRFIPLPRFEATLASVEVRSKEGASLLFWSNRKKRPICERRDVKHGAPTCELTDIGLETQAMAVSPDAHRLAIAFGGLRPRLELYAIDATPKRLWQAMLPKNSGGAVETGFSSDGQWVVVLTGKGRMHRFDVASGGSHLSIPSHGRSACAIPPGRIMAVAGDSGEVTMWYLSDGTIAWRLPSREKRGAVDRITASGDGARFALLEYTDTQTIIRVFQFHNRIMLRQITIDGLAIADIALDSEGDTLFLSHETRGLLSVSVRGKSPPEAVTTEGAGKCTGRLVWHHTKSLLACATTTGVLHLDNEGNVLKRFKTPGNSDKWLVAASAEGPRIAAVGGGRLLVWWL